MHSKREISRGHSKLLLRCNRIAHRVHLWVGSQAPNTQDKVVPSVKISKHCKVRCKPMIWLEHRRRSPPFSKTCNRQVMPIIGITMEEDREVSCRRWRVLSVGYTVATVATSRHPLVPVA